MAGRSRSRPKAEPLRVRPIRLIAAALTALLALPLLVAPAEATPPPTAADIAEAHERHGHQQWRHGRGDRGHRWTDYQREARQLRSYLRAVALARMATCARDPRCAVRLASYMTGAPHPLVAAVVGCESGWNPAAANPSSSAGGLFQFLSGTWASLAPGWGMGGRSRFETWPAAVVGSGTIAQGGIGHWSASRHCWG